jgi:flagellar protein FlbD
MILFTRLNRGAIAVNPDLIERAESTPDTVITLVDDKKLLVTESLDEVIRLITDYRAYVIARSRDLQVVDEGRPTLHLVPSDTVAAAHQPGTTGDAGADAGTGAGPDAGTGNEAGGRGQVITHPGAADRDTETS